MALRKISAGRVPVIADTSLPSIPVAKLPVIPDANLPARLQDAALDADYFGTTQIAIPDAANLNTYKTPGNYIQPANSQAASGTNYPVGKAGMLEVFSRIPGQAFEMVWQRYTVYAEGGDDGVVVFVRGNYNNSWQAWEAVNRVTVSAADPSGTAYEGAMWYKI